MSFLPVFKKSGIMVFPDFISSPGVNPHETWKLKNKSVHFATTLIHLFYKVNSSAGVTFFGDLIRSTRKI